MLDATSDALQTDEIVVIAASIVGVLGSFFRIFRRCHESHVNVLVWIMVTVFNHGSEFRALLKEKSETYSDARLLLHSVALSVMVTLLYVICGNFHCKTNLESSFSLVYDAGIKRETSTAETLLIASE